MIELTSNAARALRGLVEEKALDSASAGLRLAIEKGGCAGLQYVMSIGAAQEGDLTIESDGARLYVDHESISVIEGCRIDYEEGLSGSGFRVINPNAARSCGCGTSFEPAVGARS